MDYYINPAAFSSSFPVPGDVVDRHIRLAGEIQLKVLLYTIRNMSDSLTTEQIANGVGAAVSDVEDAFKYWHDAGIMLSKAGETAATAPQQSVQRAVSRAQKPTHTDIARRGSEDEKITFLLREAQLKFGRNLKTNEAATLVWLYDDEGMSVSVILMLLQFAISQNRCHIGYIEKKGIEWINKGITTVAEADAEIALEIERSTAWSLVSACFGFDKRLASAHELELSYKWVCEWQMSRELLKSAYDVCVDAKSKFSMPYVAKILENWHNKGIKNPADIKNDRRTAKDGIDRSYDINLFEQMLNSKD